MTIAARCFVVMVASASYAGAVDFFDVAPVVAITPLYGPVTDGRDCAPGAPQPVMVGAPPGMVGAAPQHQVAGAAPPPPPQERSLLAPVIGGVAGAALGSQIGQGRGRDAATAVGAVAGTVIADRVANPGSPGSTTGAIVGGAAGGLLGNQVGQGSGRTAATAVGAIGGAMVGDRLMSGPQPGMAPAQQPPGAVGMAPVAQAPAPCRTVDGVTREAIRGYSVVYRYAGRDITTTLPFHPGNSIRIAIGAADTMVPQPNAPQPAGAYYPPPVMAPQQVNQQPYAPMGGGQYPR